MIPTWNSNGILPPIKPGMPGHSSERSPYQVDMCDLVKTFSFSENRRVILKGLLRYRKALYDAGIVLGFQWINGSFMEDIETLENRPPNDLDIITFFHLPTDTEQQELYDQHRSLFNNVSLKEKYSVDGYFFPLGEKLDNSHIRQITYWYSMWSHRRNGLWKGFLRVDLSPKDDELAATFLS